MTKKILMIDDDRDILASYQVNFRKDFIIRIAENASQAVEILKSEDDIGVIVSDYKMPNIDGVTLLKMLKQLYPDTVRIMITGYADLKTAVNAVNEGSIYRFLTKPIPPNELKTILQDALVHYNLKKNEKDLLNNTLKGTLKLLIDLVSLSIPQTLNLGTRSRTIARRIAQKLEIEDIWELEIASLLSNIGMLLLPHEIIEKKSQMIELSYSELQIYNTFPEIGAKLLKNIPRFEKIADAILYQNESYGSRNDAHKKNENIPVNSRIIRIANDYTYHLDNNCTPLEAYDKMLENYYLYDSNLLKILLSEVVGVDNSRRIRQLKLSELKSGMVTAKDIKDESDTILLTKDKEISEPILIRLNQIAKVRNIVEPVLVYE